MVLLGGFHMSNRGQNLDQYWLAPDLPAQDGHQHTAGTGDLVSMARDSPRIDDGIHPASLDDTTSQAEESINESDGGTSKEPEYGLGCNNHIERR
jgi:hypothetical protein